MATNTTHYNLVKPAYTDPADIDVINGDMDIIDSALDDHDTTLENVENSIAIVATGNTHVAITSGQYVYVKEHTALADGLYVASSNIAANTTLSSSNLTAVSGGGMNALKASVDTLNSNFVNRFETIWTNPNPSQAFSAQTLTMNLTGVRMIIVYFRYNTTATLGISHLVPYSSVRDLAVMANSSGSFAIVTREVQIRPDSNSIQFGDCYAHTSTSGSTMDNTKMIPYKILAIK